MKTGLTRFPPLSHRHAQGFTLVELSVVLLVIGVIIGAVTIGRDVQRNAVYQRISSDFIQGWALAYDNYVARTGIVPGDTVATPTGLVGGAVNTQLCGGALRTAMQSAGVDLPAGRAEGRNDSYAYLDANGVPHEVAVCFSAVAWTEPGATDGTYVNRNRNVMVITGLTPSLAILLDNQIDGHPDARFGRLREAAQAAAAATTPLAWSVDDRMAMNSTNATALDENQVAEVTANLKMNQ